MLARMTTSVNQETFLDDCLDELVDLLAADRGLILLTSPQGATRVINARAQGRALNAYEREEISKTIIHRVHESGHSVFWEPELETIGTESMAALGILSAMAAPLQSLWKQPEAAATPARGALYVDFRDYRKEIGEHQKQLLEAAAAMVSVVLDQSQRLQATEERLRDSEARDATVACGPTLDELLQYESMATLRAEVRACLASDSPIIIEGESGVGKTLLACAIADAAGRRPVVRAALGSTDDLNTTTSELFGHERGSFSGAVARRTGLVEFANGGTLILDEVLNLPAHAQKLLLDFTQFGTYRPLGLESPEPKHSDVRIIAATNGDLNRAVNDNRFRQDLYYRLAGVTLYLPPLRERRQDIPTLAESFLRKRDPHKAWRLSVKLRRLLLSTEIRWQGNIRQLESVILRARDRAVVDQAAATVLTPDHLTGRDLGLASLSVPEPTAVADSSTPLCASFQVEPEEITDSWERLQSERETLQRFERDILELALAKHAGVVAHAARDLGLPRTSLVSRLRTLGIKPD